MAFEAERDTEKGEKKLKCGKEQVYVNRNRHHHIFLLFPWKSFTDFQGMLFFISRFRVIPFNLHMLTLMLVYRAAISIKLINIQESLACWEWRKLFVFYRFSPACPKTWRVIDVHRWLKRAGCPCVNPQSWAARLSSLQWFPCCPRACWPPPVGSTSGCWPLFLQCALWSANWIIFYDIPE